MTLIAFLGYNHSGKSSAASALIEHGFKRHSFADPLKSMLLSIGLTEEQLWGNKKEVPCELLGGKTPRHAMKELGESWGRKSIDENLWIRIWRTTFPVNGDVVVDDLRYPDEAELIRSQNGTIVKIERPDIEPDLSHPSEQHIETIKPDHVIINDGSLESLYARVSMLRARIGLQK